MNKQEDWSILPKEGKSPDYYELFKTHSQYCIFCVHLWQTVAFPQEDRKFSISALTQPTEENADRCIYCESAFSMPSSSTEKG